MNAVIDVVSAPAIAAIVFTMVQMLGPWLPAKWKPVAAVGLGIVWSVIAFGQVAGAYPNVLVAIFTGITAGAAASGIASYRDTYRPQE